MGPTGPDAVSQETCQARALEPISVGWTDERKLGMNATRTTAQATTRAATVSTSRTADASLAAILFAALLGAGLLFAAGFANSATLHAAAHDGRHSVSFPCH